MRLEKDGFVIGIKCDLCGAEHSGDFTYYSLDVREVPVSNSKHTTGISNLPIIFSLDSCPKCIAQTGDTIKVHYKPTKAGVNCDLCGSEMRGNFNFYYINVSSVTVDMSTGQIKCAACDKKLVTSEKPCQCGKDHPIKIARVNINDKYLQIVSCERDYTAMTNSAAAMRQPTDTKT